MERGIPADFPRTLGGLLDRQAELHPDRPAVAGEGCSLGYRELGAQADRIGAGLIAAGVTKGTRVGLLMPNWPMWLACAFGAAKVGAWLVGLNTLHRRAELEYTLRHADVAFLLAARSFLKNRYDEALRAIAPEVFDGGVAPSAPSLRKVLFLDDETGGGAFEELLAAGERVGDAERRAVQQTVSAADPAVVFFTSGSTATPKAAVLSHAALTYSAWSVCECLGIAAEDRTWTALPLFFSGGFCLCALPTLAAGGTVVLNGVFEPGAALRRLEDERCTVMAGYNHVAAMLEHPDFSKRRLTLRKGVGGNLDAADRFLEPGHVAVGSYGMTETATICCSPRHTDPPEIRKTFGRPIPGASIRIVDPDTGLDVAAGAEGEIIVRSPAQMSHYYGVAPSECFDERGYFHTGDLGFFDERGCLDFSKRLKDVIKTMGVNVAAPEVEQYLESHPRVRRAHVVGVKHDQRGENVAAFIVSADAALREEELVEFCREGLASYKVPRHFFFCAEADLPVSASGKIEKGRLRERAERSVAERG